MMSGQKQDPDQKETRRGHWCPLFFFEFGALVFAFTLSLCAKTLSHLVAGIWEKLA